MDRGLQATLAEIGSGQFLFGALPSFELSQSLNDFQALTALIHDRAAKWSSEARALKFDIEFKAIEQERRRVAKELHDEILPTLGRLTRSVHANDETHSCSSILIELHNTVEEFRDLLGELHPVDLEELGLVAALSNICRRYARATGRCIIFTEVSEECSLSAFQQLCLYRAVQCVLRMFSESENDLLLVSYQNSDGESTISIQCIDRRVSSAQWITGEKDEFMTFEAWCAMTNAKVEIGSTHLAQFPCDLLISVTDELPQINEDNKQIGLFSKIRLDELEAIMAHAQEEWATMIKQDCLLFESLAIATERRRICKYIDRRIWPHFETLCEMANQTLNETISAQVKDRMSQVTQDVNSVLSDLYPQLLLQAGFLPSMKALAHRFQLVSLIDTTLVSRLETEDVEISADAKFAIYRVTQEALNNIEKHSHATRALISIEQSEQGLSVSIEDNGRGLQGRTALSRGLKNIKERAAAVGASVVWDSSQSFDSGTLLRISLDRLIP